MVPIYLLCSALILNALAANVDVTVGPDLAFHPNTVNAAIGDTVNFNFASGPNSASEATARLNDPCNTEGGFDSGIQYAGGSSVIEITTQNSIYVFSSPNCASAGMVMIVNPGSASVDTYMQAAEASGGGANNAVTTSDTATSPTTTNSPTSTEAATSSSVVLATTSSALTSSIQASSASSSAISSGTLSSSSSVPSRVSSASVAILSSSMASSIAPTIVSAARSNKIAYVWGAGVIAGACAYIAGFAS